MRLILANEILAEMMCITSRLTQYVKKSMGKFSVFLFPLLLKFLMRCPSSWDSEWLHGEKDSLSSVLDMEYNQEINFCDIIYSLPKHTHTQ